MYRKGAAYTSDALSKGEWHMGPFMNRRIQRLSGQESSWIQWKRAEGALIAEKPEGYGPLLHCFSRAVARGTRTQPPHCASDA